MLDQRFTSQTEDLFMTTIPAPPQQPVEPNNEEHREVWGEYYDAYNIYEMRYKWLPQALSGEELIAAQALSDDDMFTTYPGILDGGPYGGIWYGQLVAMTDLLNRNRFKPWVQRRFIDDFRATYRHPMDAWPEGKRPTLYDRATEENLIQAYWPDVDSYYEGTTVGEFYFHNAMYRRSKKLYKKDPTAGGDVHEIGEVHAWATALSHILPEFPEFDYLRTAHAAFVTRWNLPTENNAIARARKEPRRG